MKIKSLTHYINQETFIPHLEVTIDMHMELVNDNLNEEEQALLFYKQFMFAVEEFNKQVR